MHGAWEEAFPDRPRAGIGHVITDPPFSRRTHDGHNEIRGIGKRRGIRFQSWSWGEAYYAARQWSDWLENDGWFVVMTDHVLVPAYEQAMNDAGRYTFAPIPFVHPGSRVRLAGDGPTCWAVWLVVSRPRARRISRWRALPGAYVLPPGLSAEERKPKVTGGKPLWLLRQLVRDYSNPGDLIVDPCAGAGTTGVAAVLQGRDALLIERKANLCRQANQWISSVT